jgi:hypothetical protein
MFSFKHQATPGEVVLAGPIGHSYNLTWAVYTGRGTLSAPLWSGPAQKCRPDHVFFVPYFFLFSSVFPFSFKILLKK